MRLLTKLFLFLCPAMLAAECPPAGPRVVLGIDESRSIHPEQRLRWLPAALQLASCVGPGGKLQVFAITANTANDSPLLSTGFPLLSSHTVAAICRFMALKEEFRILAKNAIQTALERSDSANVTDLFGVITRAAYDGPPGILALCTDGLESVDPNLERIPIHDKDIPQLLRSITQKRHWTGATLCRTQVFIILPNDGKQVGPNSRAELESFYRALVAAVGGNLARFENYL